MVNALDGMAQSVAYEDVDIAVNSITQIMSNILVAVNSPLLSRSPIINLDHTRSNSLPLDFEANLEDPWDNPNRFAPNGDFSIAAIEANRNIFYQKEGAKKITKNVEKTLSKTRSIMSSHLNVGQANEVNAPSISMLTKKFESKDLQSSVIKQSSGAEIRMPPVSVCQLTNTIKDCNDQTPITISVSIKSCQFRRSILMSKKIIFRL